MCGSSPTSARSATCATTSVDRRRARCGVALVIVFMASITARRDSRSAGASPKADPVTTLTITASDKTRRSSVASVNRGISEGARASIAGMRREASAMPTKPPAADSSRLSLSASRNNDAASAPIALRVANSIRRRSVLISAMLSTRYVMRRGTSMSRPRAWILARMARRRMS